MRRCGNEIGGETSRGGFSHWGFRLFIGDVVYSLKISFISFELIGFVFSVVSVV